MADWSALPCVALLAIAGRLSFSVDYIRFRSVCPSWRSAVPRRLHLPWMALNCLDGDGPIFSFSTLSLPNLTLRTLPLPPAALHSPCCGASNGWLALLERTPSISLFNPITGARIHLPPFPHFADDFGGTYEKAVDDEFIYTDPYSCRTWRINLDTWSFASRVVLSADPAATRNFVALLIRGGWKSLEFCRPGDDAWTSIKHPELIGYSADAQFYRGRFYIACGHIVYACSFGPSEGEAVEIAAADSYTKVGRTSPGTDESYLVEAGGDLLLVIIDYCGLRQERYVAQVFQLDLESKQPKLLKLKSVGDYALFLGRNQSFSLPVSRFPGMKGNRIYLADYVKHGRNRVRMIDLEDCINEFLPMELVISQSYWKPCAWFRPSLLPLGKF